MDSGFGRVSEVILLVWGISSFSWESIRLALSEDFIAFLIVFSMMRGTADSGFGRVLEVILLVWGTLLFLFFVFDDAKDRRKWFWKGLGGNPFGIGD